MTLPPVAVLGVVKSGVVVPDTPTSLAEGDRMLIVFGPHSDDEQLAAETAGWERATDEAWAKINEWENR